MGQFPRLHWTSKEPGWRLRSPEGEAGELISFDQVREQLQEKNLNFGQWLQAVLDGELVPLNLRRNLQAPQRLAVTVAADMGRWRDQNELKG